MAAYTPNFVAGAYGVTWNSQSLGYTEVGFEMIMRPSANIIRLDPTGRVPIDAIWTGVEDIVIRLESMEWAHDVSNGSNSTNIWNSAVPYMFQTGGSTITDEGKMLEVGKLLAAGSLAKSLVLTPVLGADTTHHKYTFSLAYPLEPVRTVFSAQRLRTTPFGFYCFANSFDATTIIPTLYAAATS